MGWAVTPVGSRGGPAASKMTLHPDVGAHVQQGLWVYSKALVKQVLWVCSGALHSKTCGFALGPLYSMSCGSAAGLSCAGLCPWRGLRLACSSRPWLTAQGTMAEAALQCKAESTSGPVACEGPFLPMEPHIVMLARQCSPLMMMSGTASLRLPPGYLKSGHNS